MAKDTIPTKSELDRLRVKITEGLRVQLGGSSSVVYIDPSNALTDIAARHNHVVFARRGCGKTLLLQQMAQRLPKETRHVYLNCEDYKRHSFPNVLIEILDSTFETMERHFGGWIGKHKRKAKRVLADIRLQLAALKSKPDDVEARIQETSNTGNEGKRAARISFRGLDIGAEETKTQSLQTEMEYTIQLNKIGKLDLILPRLKSQLRDIFASSDRATSIYIVLDDFYFLTPQDQPFVMDYVHRLCKDTPLYFKVATLRHASTLYIENQGQPTGAQIRHDYQPLGIEFGLHDIKSTEAFVRRIFHEYAKLAEIGTRSFDELFMGDGFSRLVLAGGGVPRDCLSLFLEALSKGVFPLGKDAIRELSRTNLERRIQELKQDAPLDEQPLLLRGIFAIRQFCLYEKQVNSFVVEERELQENGRFKALLDRLMDYRLIHEVGTAFTHKSQPGTFRGYIIDVGFYAGLRKLQGKLTEIDLASDDWREKIRSSPVLGKDETLRLWKDVPIDAEARLLTAGELDTSQG